jgi:hypothetical protein
MRLHPRLGEQFAVNGSIGSWIIVRPIVSTLQKIGGPLVVRGRMFLAESAIGLIPVILNTGQHDGRLPRKEGKKGEQKN